MNATLCKVKISEDAYACGEYMWQCKSRYTFKLGRHCMTSLRLLRSGIDPINIYTYSMPWCQLGGCIDHGLWQYLLGVTVCILICMARDCSGTHGSNIDRDL